MTQYVCHFVIGVVGLLAAYLLFWPVNIQPVPWNPPRSPGFHGIYAENHLLAETQRIAEGAVGPETVALASDGRLYAGLRDGRIIRFSPDDESSIETFADTGGSPGGMQFDARGHLIVADADLGLLSIAPDGQIRVLTNEAEGQRMRFPDDLDIAADGTIWFTNGSQRFPEHHDAYEFLEGRPTGQLITYDPATDETVVRLDGLRFANGVALGPDETFVLVNETLGYRTTRLWIKGPRAGQIDHFVENLPVLPDNVTYNGRDLFWIAGFLPRDPLLDWARGRGAFLKKLALRLPLTWMDAIARPAPYGFVIAVDINGDLVHNLQDPTGHYGGVTSALEVNDHLYLGSLTMSAVGRVKIPSRPTAAASTKRREASDNARS